MSFPSSNNFPPIEVTSEFAVPAGNETSFTREVDPPEGSLLGLSQFTSVIDGYGSIFVTLLDADGNSIPIDSLIVVLSSEGLQDDNTLLKGVTINFSQASVGNNSLTLQDMATEKPIAADFFARYFQAITAQNAKVLVPGFTSFTEAYANSNFNLSQGNDAVLLTTLNNVVYGNDGNDAFVVTAYARNPGTGTRSYINLGSGNDDVQITKAALKQNKSKLNLQDFTTSEDTISLDTKAKKVDGIGTDKLKITTKKSKFVIKSIEPGANFKEKSIDFI